MTPKEKAEQLVEKCTMNTTTESERYAKKLALIIVDEVIGYGYKPEFPYKYWEEVKQEIDKL